MIQKDENSLFEEEDFIINFMDENNVLVGGFKASKDKKRQKKIIKQASKDEGIKAKEEQKLKKAKAKEDKKAKKKDAETAIIQSKSIITKNIKSRVALAKDGISKENIDKIDKLPKDGNYRSELRKIVSEDVSKLDITKIDEMMPKDLSVIIRDVESKTNKPLSIDEKRKILAEYKINMIDTKTFEDGSSGFKRKMQQSIYNIHSISHGRMSGLELSKNNTKTVNNAARNLTKNKEGMRNPMDPHQVQTEAVKAGIEKREVDSSFKKKQNTLSTAIKEQRAELNTQTEKLNKLENEKTNIDTKITKNEAEINDLRVLISNEDKIRIDLLRIDTQKLEAEARNLYNKQEELDANLKFLNDEKNKINNDNKMGVEDKKKNLKKIEEDIKDKEDKIKTMEKQIKTTEEKLKKKRELDAQIEKIDNAKKNKTIDNLEKTNNNLKTINETKNTEIEQMKKTINRSKKQIKRTERKLNEHLTNNPDKTFNSDKYNKSIENVRFLNENEVKDLSNKRNNLKDLQSSINDKNLTNEEKKQIGSQIKKLKTDIKRIENIDMTNKNKQITDIILKKNNDIENLNKQLENTTDEKKRKEITKNIQKIKNEIIVENRKLNLLQQKQTETTLTNIKEILEKQGFSKNEIDKVIASTKDKELFGDTIKDKMTELEFIIDKTIKSPDFKININIDKIKDLQSKLENTKDKTEQSKIRRQITDLETANKKLEKRKTIMNNSGNSALKRKDKGKLITVIDKKLNRIDKNLQFFKKSINNINKKQPKDLTPGDKAAIERYKQFQQNKSRLELRKSELQTQIRNKTFNKITKGFNTKSIEKMDNKEFKIFKKIMDVKLDTPEKKKDFQSRFEIFKDALDKGSNSLAKSQAQFIKDQYGIDVKQFKFDNLSKMGEFYKNNVAKYNEKIQEQKKINTEIRKVGSLLNKNQKLKKRGKILRKFTRSKSQQKKIMNKLGNFNTNILKQVQTEGVKKIEEQKKESDERKKKQEEQKRRDNEFKTYQQQEKTKAQEKKKAAQEKKKVNKQSSSINKQVTKTQKARNMLNAEVKRMGGMKENTTKKEEYNKKVSKLEKIEQQLSNQKQLQQDLKTSTTTQEKQKLLDNKKKQNNLDKIEKQKQKLLDTIISKSRKAGINNARIDNYYLKETKTGKKLDAKLEKLQEAQKQLQKELLPTSSQTGGNLPKRLHPKKKYSKKAYQFSKSKNRTKKQLI